ncbi:MAG: aldehyde ferredoxin oxidoreductase family protein [Halanaerobiales bacterium]|nr:aldehyde ferredoxin oxidoreductase family protein [Halanaerobiales bacterium]
MKWKSYMGKMLIIDLSNKSHEIKETPTDLIENYIGGKGFGVKLYQKYIKKDTDPLSPENALFFLTGPLTGTIAPAFRSCIVTRSPLTGTWLDSYFGGHFGQEIKYAGYDAIIIKGKSETSTYITIENNNIEFHEADELKQIMISKTTEIIKDKHGDEFRVACIGPAGENLVKYALVCCEPMRQAGRGGAGAVMGSKNLKALAIKGDNLVKTADNVEFLKAVNKAYEELNNSPSIKTFNEVGTPSSIPFAQNIGMLPTENYKNGQFDNSEQLESKQQSNAFWQRDIACSGCPIACGKIGEIYSGKFKGTISDTIEYETLGLIGSNLGISDINYVTKIANLCDELGLDTISTGGSIGFAIEAAKNSDLSFLNNLDLEFGNAESIIELVKNIASRKNKLGDLLAEGVKKASEHIPESTKYSVHVKGLETPAWPPRGAPGMGLALMTADRGGCHQRAFPVSYEIGSEQWNDKFLERLSTDKKAEVVVYQQNKLAALDTLIKCDFGTYGISEDTYRLLLNTATGMNLPKDYWQKLGAKIWDETRRINLKHGFDRKDDYLPDRFVKEPLPDGPAKGHRITQSDMDIMLDQYYNLRGWNKKGEPPENF